MAPPTFSAECQDSQAQHSNRDLSNSHHRSHQSSTKAQGSDAVATAVSIAKLFVKVNAPYVLVPKGARKTAARIARDFVSLLEGFVERYDQLYGTSLTVAEGMKKILDSDMDPASLFARYRVIAEESKVILSPWQSEKGFDEGWRWLTPEFARWFTMNVLPKKCSIDEWHTFVGAPLLTKTIVEHVRGRQWMEGFVEQLKNFLYPNAPIAPSTSGAAN